MKDKVAILVLLLVSGLALRPLTADGLFRSHDSLAHVYRQASFSSSLKQGNLVPRWGGNLNRGYGHPALMFHYPLIYYLGHGFHLAGFSFVTAVKLTIGLGWLLAAVGLYWLARRFVSRWVALAAAVVFISLPYRLVLIYVRGAVAEHLALSLTPWFLWGLDRTVTKPSRKRVAVASLLTAALILSHQAVSLMMLPVGAILVAVRALAWKPKPRWPAARSFLTVISLALGLSAFFWLPAVVEGKYTHRDQLILAQDYVRRYPAPRELFYSPWGWGLGPLDGARSGHSVSLGWVSWLALGVGTIWLITRRNKRLSQPLLIVGWLGMIGGLFFLLPVSRPMAFYLWGLRFFQFPWRFLSLTAISASLLSTVIWRWFPSWISLLILLLVVVNSIGYHRIQGVIDSPRKDEDFSPVVATTTETGELTPRWATSFQDLPPEEELQVVSGAEIEYDILDYQYERHQYRVVATQKTQVVDNTLYFPGWKVYIDTAVTPINFQDQNWRGLITFPVSAGEHELELVFEETRLRKLANGVSLLAVGMMIALLV